MGRDEVPVYRLSIVAQILKHNSFITMYKITKWLKERNHGFSVAQNTLYKEKKIKNYAWLQHTHSLHVTYKSEVTVIHT